MLSHYNIIADRNRADYDVAHTDEAVFADYHVPDSVIDGAEIFYNRIGAYPEVVEGQDVHPGTAADYDVAAPVVKKGIKKPPYPQPGAGFIPGDQ